MSVAALAPLETGTAASRPLFLDPEVEVAWAGDGFQLQRRDGSLAHDLSPAQALALLLLADSGDQTLARATAEAAGPALASGVDQVLHRFPAYLRGDTARPFDPRWWG